MKRLVEQTLTQWKTSSIRKPLIIRGARQVGKTTTVREFAKSFEHFIEINFEANENVRQLFTGDLDAKKVLSNLQFFTAGQTILPNTLFFLDEIQACPRAIIGLRYLYEQCPEIHVIAAGSLLEFALEKVGVPVGRISFMDMRPMSYIEFIQAMGYDALAQQIIQNPAHIPFNDAVHNKAVELLGEYMAIGGMPQAVAAWRDHRNYQDCLEIHHDIIRSYQQDFEKYAKKTQIKYVELLFNAIPHQLGKQFKYSQISTSYRKRELAPALDLLCKANVIQKITHSAGQGTPLGAQAAIDINKFIMLDIAITQAILGHTAEQWVVSPQTAYINKGEIAEAFVGQELLAYANPRWRSQLYYWQRHQRGSSAEIDYLITTADREIIPIEVKAGTTGSLKSMQQFMLEHTNTAYGIRYSMYNYSVIDKLHSYPLYAVAHSCAIANTTNQLI